MTGAWRVAAHTRDTVGEGPLWLAREAALYWVDVLGPAINRISLVDGTLRRWAMPEPIGFIVPRERGGFIVGLQSGLYALDLEPFTLERLVDPEPHLPANRMNDGKVDAAGRLWAGSMPMDGKKSDGTLYRCDPDLCCYPMDSGYRVTNGPAFSPDQDYLYVADSPKRTVYRLGLDAEGMVHSKAVFIEFPADWGYPDGMTVDSVGCLWVAHWDGGCVSRFDSEGTLDRRISLPTARITSCVFAGPELDRLFVTSASLDFKHEPLAGALFEIDCPKVGLPSTAFAG